MLPYGVSRPVDDPHGQYRGVRGAEHPTRRAGPGEQQRVPVRVRGDPVEDPTGDLLVAQHPEARFPWRGRIGRVSSVAVPAVAEERETPVDQPFDQPGRVLDVGRRRPRRARAAELAGHRPSHLDHALLVAHDVPHVAKHHAQLLGELLRFVGRHRVDLDADPEFRRRAGPRLARREHLDEGAGLVPANRDDGVNDLPDPCPGPAEPGQQ